MLTSQKSEAILSKPELKDYKSKILTVNKAKLRLERGLYFTGLTQRGYDVEYDVQYEEGCSPTETLLLSIGACLSIDLVHILRKMRCEITSYAMDIEGIRKETPPQYYTAINIKIKISGQGVSPDKLDKAIALSQAKYCSVYHSLRDDINYNITYEVE